MEKIRLSTQKNGYAQYNNVIEIMSELACIHLDILNEHIFLDEF